MVTLMDEDRFEKRKDEEWRRTINKDVDFRRRQTLDKIQERDGKRPKYPGR